MTEDVVFLRPGHPPMVGRSAFAESAQPQPGQQPPEFDGTNEIQEIQVLGDWAFAWAKLKVAVTLPGKDPMIRAGHTLSIFKKDAGEWRLARDANMLSAGES